MLRNGAKPDSQETNGTNALVINAKDELADIIKIKVNPGLKPDMSVSENMTAMLVSSQNGQLEAVRLSRNDAAKLSIPPNSDKITAFIRATRSGHITIVKIAIKKNSPIDIRKTIRLTDLMAASLNGHAEIVKLLLEKGANPGLINNEGKTALDYAENSNIKSLLEKAGSPVQNRPE